MSETFEQWFEKRMTSPDEWEQAKTYDWLKDCWHARDAEIQALRDQLAEARKDSERLEWMARNHGKLCYYDVKRTWWVEYLDPNSSEEETLTGPDVQHDFREAIDAAIEAAGKERGE